MQLVFTNRTKTTEQKQQSKTKKFLLNVTIIKTGNIHFQIGKRSHFQIVFGPYFLLVLQIKITFILKGSDKRMRGICKQGR